LQELDAEQIIELFRNNQGARRRLAELLVSEPDIRLAIINAVLRDTATKQDMERLRDEVIELRRELKEEIRDLRSDIRDLRARIWWVVATIVLGWLSALLIQFLR